jgi:hypothetical protein
MTIFGIDPGTTESALVSWENNQVAASCIIPNDMVLLELARCDTVVIEQIISSNGMAVGKETFRTVEWIGRFWQRALDVGKTVVLIPRGVVKNTVCHSARAKDGNIRQALIDIYGPPGTKKNPGVLYGLANDGWQAMALIHTYLTKEKI